MQDAMDISTGELLPPSLAFYGALQKAIEKLPAVLENDADGQRSKYASYAQCVNVIRPKLLEQDIIFSHGQEKSWKMNESGGAATRVYLIYTDFIHTRSGQRMRTTLEMPLPKLDPQAAGSALTYGKRYTLLAGLGLATADDPMDDDAQKAMPNRISADFVPSDTYIELRDELEAIEKPADLAKWFKSVEKDQRLQVLTQQEAGSLNTLSRQKREALANE